MGVMSNQGIKGSLQKNDEDASTENINLDGSEMRKKVG